MAENASPLSFQDLFGRVHIEPSVTGLILTQQKESPRAINPNDIIMLADFRSGAPGVLRRFSSVGAVRNTHDPDNNADLGVALLGATRDPFGDDGVFGSADFLTVRVGAPTPATSQIKNGSTSLLTITTGDYGRQTNRCKRLFTEETDVADTFKLVLRDENNTKRIFTGRHLGPLFSVEYTGDAGGCDVSVRGEAGRITYTGQPTEGDSIIVNGVEFEFDSAFADIAYTGQPADADTLSITAGGTTKVYEFDDDDAVTGTNIKVTIGATAADTYTALGVAITANQASIVQAPASGHLVLKQYTTGVSMTDAASNATVTNTAGVSGTNVPVIIAGITANTYAALLAAIESNCGLSVVQTSGQLNMSSDEMGVVLIAGAALANATVSATGTRATVLALTLTGADPTDGSQSWVFPLTISSYATVTQLVAQINSKAQFKASLPAYETTNPFMASTALDLLEPTSCTMAKVLYGYAAAIADWVNSRTQGNYSAVVDNQNLTPDEDTVEVAFSGGTSPAAVTITDYTDALDVVGSEVQLGGIIITDTTDEAVMAAIVAFIADQQARGKWFRAFFGTDPYANLGTATVRAAKFGQIASGLDASRGRLVCQRMGVFGTGGAISYVSSLYLAATMAGGAAGNLPYINPLTMKRLRYADVHPDDRFDETTREALIQAGVTVVKREGTSRVVSLAVTTSQDPSRRMNRVMSERDTVDEIDANVRQAFLPFRGKWANLSLAATVPGVMKAVLDRYVRAGAISKGIDPDSGRAVPAWEGLPIGPNGESWILNQGVLQIRYRIYVPGELNHISLAGFAEYVALAGSIGGSVAELSTTIPA